MHNQQYILILSCPDRPGIVYNISKILFDHQGNILEAGQYHDQSTGLFFMRVCFACTQDNLKLIKQSFNDITTIFDLKWQLVSNTVKMKTLIMVSKQGHCLNDLLFRYHSNMLPIEVAGVVSNHRDYYQLCASYNIPFHHISITAQTKEVAEAKLWEIVQTEQVELIVLARYMQILSNDFCSKMPGKIINIHHSFLPSFKGAKPYYQAHSRGVKLIGATAHYVTADLDEGPIIEQDVSRVDHSLSVEDLTTIGKDIESQVLARAVKWHSENRIILNNDKTVIFN